MTRVYQPNLIMSVHPFGASESWNNDIAEAVRTLNCTPVQFIYDSSEPIDKSKTDTLIIQFKEWYLSIMKDPVYNLDINDPLKRPSIVADGFGTWIVGEAIKKFRDIKFDKLFIYNSIIPTSFDWYLHIMKDQVQLVITEISTEQPSQLPQMFAENQPMSGNIGFEQLSRFHIYEDKSKFKESDSQLKERFLSHYRKYLSLVPSQLCVVYGRDLSLQEFRIYFEATSRLDAEIYGEAYTENPIAIETALTWAEKEPDIWSFLLDSYSKEVIGYLNILPVNDSTFDSFLNGTLQEKDIQPENLMSYKNAGVFNLIIMSIAVKMSLLEPPPGMPPSRHGELLQMALMQKAVDLTITKERSINRIANTVWTNSGLKISERFGMEKTDVAYMENTIYAAQIENILKKNSDKLSPTAKWLYKRLNAGTI